MAEYKICKTDAKQMQKDKKFTKDMQKKAKDSKNIKDVIKVKIMQNSA